jgi:hypothetical protein
MAGIDEKRLEDLRGVLLTWRLRLRQADGEIEQAQKDHKQTRPFCADAIGYLEAQLEYDQYRRDRACETFFNPALPLEQRQAAAAEFTQLQDDIRQAETDIGTLEAEVASCREKIRQTEVARAAAKKEYEQALRRMTLALLEISTDPHVRVFRRYFKKGWAGVELKPESDMTGEVHIYCRLRGDLHYQQGHLVLRLEDGKVSFMRRFREQRPEALYYSNRYEALLVYDKGVGSLFGESAPFLL